MAVAELPKRAEAEPAPHEPEPPQEPVRMTPSQVRMARQLSRADRFHELLVRNSMDI